MQKNKGITLVALVITIIILLILSGVAISMITGGEGLFAQANGAATKYNQAAKNEADMINQLLNGNYTFGGNGETPKEPVPDLIKESNMDFIYKPDTWINGTVNVEITTSITGYTLQYSLDNGTSWDNYTEEIPVTTNGKVILARLADGERTGGIATGQVENIDTQGPKAFNLTATADETSITVSADGTVEDADEIEGVSGKSGIRGYQFKLMNNDGTTKVDWTKEQAGPSYTFNTGLTAGTIYKISMRAIDKAENVMEATNGENGTTTISTGPVEPSAVAQVGDFVNYSVTVDGVTYDQWRILHFDTNGHMEIVCYNGPLFTLGGGINKEKNKSDYANAIKLLNDASQPYKNGIYGESARHLGSDPTNPSSYETISEEYVKIYTGTTIDASARPYLTQKHYKSDSDAVYSFSGTTKLNISNKCAWLAARDAETRSTYSTFYMNCQDAQGYRTLSNLCLVNSSGSQNMPAMSRHLAPVVSLKSGIKIIIPGSKDASEDGKWTLTDQ